ncbi:hypothetical protein CSOJ01_02198 [Colletotrichum sojae]|uniref:Sulfate permease ii n=1 Tax=Colletotrichum sojae TaxID=2175907 RepID=A0A8H6JRX8_9PEZI|nr:hypothetical protein CSOJ01_02198 [Colletotrichum sojae]
MRIASNAILRAVIAAAWLASTALAAPGIVDREDPPPTPPAPPKPIATADEVDITRPNTTGPADPSKPRVPIAVQLFASSPGVKTCRAGAKIVDLELPANVSTNPRFATGNGQCYDLPATAQCGLFTGNKADGCEAKLFRGQRCTSFVNVAVFTDELRPVGGFFASMAIKCGIKAVEPPPLNLGGLGGKMQKPTGGKKSARARSAVEAAIGAG